MTRKIIAILCLMSLTVFAFAQTTAEEEVMKPINTLFEGMKKADSTIVKKAFSVEAKMYTSYKNKEGKEKIKEELLSNFLKAIGSKKPNTPDWNEKLFNTQVKVDGNIAQVWTEYSFFLGDKFIHCGVNAFQLIKENSTWKIVHIMDTRRKENCNQNYSD